MQNILNNIIITNPKLHSKLYLRPATLYYLRLEFADNTSMNGIVGRTNVLAKSPQCPIILYKLGYTTTSLNERIFGKLPSYTYKIINGKRKYIRASGHNGMGLPQHTKVYEVACVSNRNASYIYQVEQYLHSLHAKHCYEGAKVMGNGNTELYTVDILGLDN